MLTINDVTHFDDNLLEEEVDFICGTYYVYTSKFPYIHIPTKLSWWPRALAWAGSVLDVGFWSE
ncbi:hypothetical protein P692DRAFT_201699166 [Suillus brevipes Sb2]|nr:hypothetical protein P692DRAFT_201699166 [Suillus brevipes Sb2]